MMLSPDDVSEALDGEGFGTISRSAQFCPDLFESSQNTSGSIANRSAQEVPVEKSARAETA